MKNWNTTNHIQVMDWATRSCFPVIVLATWALGCSRAANKTCDTSWNNKIDYVIIQNLHAWRHLDHSPKIYNPYLVFRHRLAGNAALGTAVLIHLKSMFGNCWSQHTMTVCRRWHFVSHSPNRTIVAATQNSIETARIDIHRQTNPAQVDFSNIIDVNTRNWVYVWLANAKPHF